MGRAITTTTTPIATLMIPIRPAMDPLMSMAAATLIGVEATGVTIMDITADSMVTDSAIGGAPATGLVRASGSAASTTSAAAGGAEPTLREVTASAAISAACAAIERSLTGADVK